MSHKNKIEQKREDNNIHSVRPMEVTKYILDVVDKGRETLIQRRRKQSVHQQDSNLNNYSLYYNTRINKNQYLF